MLEKKNNKGIDENRDKEENNNNNNNVGVNLPKL